MKFNAANCAGAVSFSQCLYLRIWFAGNRACSPEQTYYSANCGLVNAQISSNPCMGMLLTFNLPYYSPTYIIAISFALVSFIRSLESSRPFHSCTRSSHSQWVFPASVQNTCMLRPCAQGWLQRYCNFSLKSSCLLCWISSFLTSCHECCPQ